MTVIQISALRRILVTCVCRLSVSVTWRTVTYYWVLTPTEKKGMGGQRVTLSLAQPRWRPLQTCKKDQYQFQQIKQELEMPGQVGLTRDISVIFHRSRRQGEAIVIIVWFMDNDWNITQRLVRIEVCSKSVNANQLAQVLNQCLSVEYRVRGNSLLAAMRDGASVNQAALNIVSFIFPNMVNIVCFSHT